jgi:hypothetical protein
LDSICLIAYGARLNHKTKSISKSAYIYKENIKNYKPFLEGENIERYYFSKHGWLDYRPKEHYNPMFVELFENQKIMFINVVKDKLRFAYDEEGQYFNSHTVVNCVRLDKLANARHVSAKKAVSINDLETVKKYDYKFLLGILNSKLITWFFDKFLSEGLHFYPNDAKQLPIPKINDISETVKICELVSKMIIIQKQLHAAKTENDIKIYQQKADIIDKQIDALVYSFYGLNKDEIKIAEENE